MTSSRYTPQSPEVVAILDGIWKSGVKTYYRIDADGKHIDVRIREELIAALGISSKLATRLLQLAELPCAPFVCTRVREKAMTVVVADDDEIELDELDDVEPDSPPLENVASPATSKVKRLTVEEREEKAARQEDALNDKRYSYVTTSSEKHGVYDGHDGRVVALFYSRDEAIEELLRLKSGKSCAVTFTGSSTVKPGITY